MHGHAYMAGARRRVTRMCANHAALRTCMHLDQGGVVAASHDLSCGASAITGCACGPGESFKFEPDQVDPTRSRAFCAQVCIWRRFAFAQPPRSTLPVREQRPVTASAMPARGDGSTPPIRARTVRPLLRIHSSIRACGTSDSARPSAVMHVAAAKLLHPSAGCSMQSQSFDAGSIANFRAPTLDAGGYHGAQTFCRQITERDQERSRTRTRTCRHPHPHLPGRRTRRRR